MALSQQLGFPDVPKSITNPNTSRKDAIDVGYPMSTLTFIKIINVTFEPETIQRYYNTYINKWNTLTKTSVVDDRSLIVSRYRDFLKDISLNYTTLEEKEFLSSIDFNDPYDLEVSMGFYGKKIREIVDFYNSRRNDIGFSIIRNKLKGSNFGLEKSISEITLSYLKTLDDDKILYDFNDIRSNLEIEIDELYDNHPHYFNQTPDSSIYDYKDLDYGFDIFLKDDITLISEIFSNLSDELKNIKEVDALFENRRKLTEKYLFTDFYYLSTGDTIVDFVSGKLLDNVSPTSNFFNRNYPTTASTDADQTFTKRDQGFFTPSNTSIILVDGERSSFSYNLSNLKPNSLYYFPDPNIIGNNGDIITFIADDKYLKRNITSGAANKQPYIGESDTKYYGYVSRVEPTRSKYLDSIFDIGYVKDQKRDIYGNLFGLFVDDGQFYKNVEISQDIITPTLLLNGHTFYDNIYGEGFSFDYYTVDTSTFNETIRSGLSTNTGNLSAITSAYTIFLGTFDTHQPTITPKDENLITSYNIIENGYIMNGDIPYNDAISSDLSAFETNTGSFYYNTLRECALHTAFPTQRALLDPLYPSLTANLTEYIRSSATIDGGLLGIPTNFDTSFSSIEYAYDDSNTNITEFDSIKVPSLDRTLYIKNTSSKIVNTLLDTLPYITNKYAPEIIADMVSKISNYDVVGDVLFLESDNYLTVNKLNMLDGDFVDPKTPSIYFEHSFNSFDKMSNRFKVGNYVYYCKMYYISLDDNNFTLYPEIYKFNLINFKNTQIFPTLDLDLEVFKIYGNDVQTLFCDPPQLTYNSRNNIYNISLLLKDQNNHPTLHSYDFTISPDVVLLDRKITYFGNDSYSNIFNTTSLETFNNNLSSYPTSIVDGELIL